MTVADLERRVGSGNEIAEWQAFFRIEAEEQKQRDAERRAQSQLDQVKHSRRTRR